MKSGLNKSFMFVGILILSICFLLGTYITNNKIKEMNVTLNVVTLISKDKLDYYRNLDFNSLPNGELGKNYVIEDFTEEIVAPLEINRAYVKTKYIDADIKRLDIHVDINTPAGLKSVNLSDFTLRER